MSSYSGSWEKYQNGYVHRRRGWISTTSMFLLHLFKQKVLLHNYAERNNIISDWQVDIWSQISQAGLLLLEMYEWLQFFKNYLNACALTQERLFWFGPELRHFGGLFQGSSQTLVQFHTWLLLPPLISHFQVALRKHRGVLEICESYTPMRAEKYRQD